MNKILAAGAFVLLLIGNLCAQPIFPTGCLHDAEIYNHVLKAPPMRLTRSLLPIRASVKQFSPKPRNQSPYNTCVGWATAYSAYSIIDAQLNGSANIENNTDNAYSPSFIYNQLRQQEDCSSSIYIHEALEKLKVQGCLRLAEFPFDCDAKVNDDFISKAKNKDNIITEYRALYPYEDLQQDQVTLIRKSLSEQNPVIVSMKCYDSFLKAGDDGVWNGVEDKYYGYHAMVIVGYDDNVNGGSFEVMNSWGVGWAHNGFGWVKYEDFAKNCGGAYELVKNLSYKKVDQSLVVNKGYDKKLQGKMRLERDSGEPMDAYFDSNAGFYKLKQSYNSGTRFRIFASNNEPSYCYVIGCDAYNKSFQLFPYKEGMSAALPYRENEVAIPGEKAYIKLDEVKGSDYVVILYSKKMLNVDDIRKKIEADKSSDNIYKKVSKAIGERILEPKGIQYKKAEINFDALGMDNSVVPLIIQIEHK